MQRYEGMAHLLQVFYGLPIKGGDRILTSVMEYGSNYIAFLQASADAMAFSYRIGVTWNVYD